MGGGGGAGGSQHQIVTRFEHWQNSYLVLFDAIILKVMYLLKSCKNLFQVVT